MVWPNHGPALVRFRKRLRLAQSRDVLGEALPDGAIQTFRGGRRKAENRL
jgi:hypothetical protein